MEITITEPADIERRSMEIIAQELRGREISQKHMAIVKRVIHTSADFDYAENLVFSKNAVEKGLSAIREGCVIVTDTRMAEAGINKRVLAKFGGESVCFMSDPDVAEEARDRGVTRAVISMERVAEIERPLILAIGNAPTAVIRACQLVEEGKLSPELIIGAPVGFVNVVESKEHLIKMPCEHIVARGRKGGSSIAAAICNAMLYTVSNNERE